MSEPTKSITTSASQRNYLKLRVNHAVANARKSMRDRRDEDRKEPAKIVAARRLIKTWENGDWVRRTKEMEKRETVLEKAVEGLQEILHFGSPDDALEACKKFEIWVDKEFES